MKKNFFIPKVCFVSLVFLLPHGFSHAMPGMHGSGSGAATEHPRVSNSIAGKINSTGSEMEITYSADGSSAINTEYKVKEAYFVYLNAELKKS